MEIPVYLLTGVLESGKTSFIRETLSDEEFTGKARTLLIVTEEGETEYDELLLKKFHTDMVVIGEEEELTEELLYELNKKYRPSQVVVEYNGMWKMERILTMNLPKSWVIVQLITMVNAATFEVYINNMRSILSEQFQNADMIIFNRCSEATSQSFCRRNVKAVNRRAQVYFEMEDGTPAELEEGELPFDLDAPVIQIGDEDFGIWYIDAVDHVEKYVGKTVKFRGMVYRPDRFPKGTFVPGRFAMTCCADDTAFIGFVCKYDKAENLKNRQWVMVTAKVQSEYQKEYRDKGPVLYAESIAMTGGPEEKLVYFN